MEEDPLRHLELREGDRHAPKSCPSYVRRGWKHRGNAKEGQVTPGHLGLASRDLEEVNMEQTSRVSKNQPQRAAQCRGEPEDERRAGVPPGCCSGKQQVHFGMVGTWARRLWR